MGGLVGVEDGVGVGIMAVYVGAKDGETVGLDEGESVGEKVDFPGRYVGSQVGSEEGEALGAAEGGGVGLPATKVGNKVG